MHIFEILFRALAFCGSVIFFVGSYKVFNSIQSVEELDDQILFTAFGFVPLIIGLLFLSVFAKKGSHF